MTVATQNLAAEPLHGLSSEHARLLEVLSVVHAPNPATKLVEVLDAVKVFGPTAPWTVHTLRLALESLKKRGLVLEKSTRHWCVVSVREHATRQAVRSGLFDKVAAYLSQQPCRHSSNWRCKPKDGYHDPDELVRDLRLATYRKDVPTFRRLMELYPHFSAFTCDPVHPLIPLGVEPFDPDWLDSLPGAMLDAIAHEVVYQKPGPATGPFVHWWTARLLKRAAQPTHDAERLHLAEQAVRRGDIDMAEALLAPVNTPVSLALRGFLATVRGALEVAIPLYARLVVRYSYRARS